MREPDPEVIESLSSGLGISELWSRILASRGVKTPEEARVFVEPSESGLLDPFLFGEMEKAVSAVERAVSSGGKILVHGDYDADGICGAAMLYNGLAAAGADVHYFVPDRVKDGYGLSRRMMERGVEKRLGLVISVDCGSGDGEIVEYLAARGVESVITDHHETDSRIPGASAFLNPKLPGEPYPFKELAGVGVAFKLLQALEIGMGVDLGTSGLLDLVAVGTLGDYSSLTGENRSLVALGMNKLGEWKRPGFEALRAECGLSPTGFTARQICFTIVPRLNSPGRMGSARSVVRLLTTEDPVEAARIAASIENENSRRKAFDSRVTEEARYLADVVLRRGDPSALVFSSASWHEGVVGIGAARLAENYNLPSVLIAVRDGVGKGSGRTAGRVNMKEALARCEDCLITFGGHREAGGFTIEESEIPRFNRKFNAAVEEMMSDSPAGGPVFVDAEALVEECNLALTGFLGRLEPFGPGNHEPLLMLRGVEVAEGTRIVGRGHLRIRVGGRAERDIIGFSLGKTWSPADIIGSKVDVLCHVRKNRWRGREELQIQATVLRLSESLEKMEEMT